MALPRTIHPFDPEEVSEQTDDDISAIDHADHSWIESMRKKVNEAHPNLHPTKPATIFKAPHNIRQSNEALYEPSVVSIGPFHYGSQKGSILDMQGYKWMCLRYLLSRHQNCNEARRIFDRCLLELKARDKKVRGCYSEDIDCFSSHELASIMLLDGSFIVYLLLRKLEEEDFSGERTPTRPNKREHQETHNIILENDQKVKDSMMDRKEKGKALMTDQEDTMVVLDIGDEKEDLDGPRQGNLWTWNLVVYDLVKLENQIPFFIIRILFKLLQTPDDRAPDLVPLALELFSGIHPSISQDFQMMPQYYIHHLLHLFHSSIVGDWQASLPVTTPADEASASPDQWIPNAKELAMAGVRFKKKENSNCFLDVSFENGVLEIPLLQVYDYTNSLFRNLIAFEQCYAKTNSYVTTYAFFMACIIDTADDVRLLNLRSILINRLSTNDEVACLFNQLCNQIHYDPHRNYLIDVFVKVMKYHESKWHRWRAGLVRDYFSNPWAIISVVAAVLLLLLTIEQSFFAAFSSFRPT